MGRRKKTGRSINGWLVLDKPSGVTSAGAVSLARRALNARKAGHAGTLDPLATGILPIAFGEATKTLPYVVDKLKSYQFTLRWGIATQTEDKEGEIIDESPVRPSEAKIQVAMQSFVGEIEQVPPSFSAIKINGQRAYQLSRKGVPVNLLPRRIWIETFELIEVPDTDHAIFFVKSRKGAYMRSLARDLAIKLGTVGHISALRRIAVGQFTEKEAISLDELSGFGQSHDPFNGLLPVEAPLDDIPALDLTVQEAAQLRNGQAVSLLRRHDLERISAFNDGLTVLVTALGKPVALTKYSAGEVYPVRVLSI